MMYGKKDTLNKWLLAAAVLVMLLYSGSYSMPPSRIGYFAGQQLDQELVQEQEPNGLEAGGETEDPWDSIPVEKRKLKLMLFTSIAVILGFFLVVLLISLKRMGSYYRRLVFIRRKSKPTEYVDAWSNYRLKENWQDDLPDEFKKTDTN